MPPLIARRSPTRLRQAATRTRSVRAPHQPAVARARPRPAGRGLHHACGSAVRGPRARTRVRRRPAGDRRAVRSAANARAVSAESTRPNPSSVRRKSRPTSSSQAPPSRVADGAGMCAQLGPRRVRSDSPDPRRDLERDVDALRPVLEEPATALVARVVAADEGADRRVGDRLAAQAPFATRGQCQPAKHGRHIRPLRDRGDDAVVHERRIERRRRTPGRDSRDMLDAADEESEQPLLQEVEAPRRRPARKPDVTAARRLLEADEA